MSDAAASLPGATFLVDSAGRIRESSAPELAVGEVLAPSSWLGEAALDAIEGATRTCRPQQRVGRDRASGACWILHASIASVDPWLAQVVAFDATPAVSSDREVIFAKLVHSMRNVAFALGSVLDVVAIDRPTGAQLDECLEYLRQPLGRLSTIATHLGAYLAPPRCALGLVRVEDILERALVRAAHACVGAPRPADVALSQPGMTVAGDVDALSETVATMLEDAGTPRVEVDRVDVGGRPHARIVVDRPAPRGQEAVDVAGAWDLHGGQRFETQLRLEIARRTVLAHGGRVVAERAAPDRVRLGMLLPLLTAG